MQGRNLLILCSLFLSLTLFSQTGLGHAQLLVQPHPDDPNPAAFNSPIPRLDNDDVKNTLPCGPDGGKRAPLKAYVRGSTIKVMWKETIDHTGVFRFDFSSDNDSTFTRLIPDIPDLDNPNMINRNVGQFYSTDITLPDIECANCTLRMTQSMGAIDDNNDYFSCADIALVNPGSDTNIQPPPVADNTGSSTQSSELAPTKNDLPEFGSGFIGCGRINGSGPSQGPGPWGYTLVLFLLLPLALMAALKTNWLKQKV